MNHKIHLVRSLDWLMTGQEVRKRSHLKFTSHIEEYWWILLGHFHSINTFIKKYVTLSSKCHCISNILEVFLDSTYFGGFVDCYGEIKVPHPHTFLLYQIAALLHCDILPLQHFVLKLVFSWITRTLSLKSTDRVCWWGGDSFIFFIWHSERTHTGWYACHVWAPVDMPSCAHW